MSGGFRRPIASSIAAVPQAGFQSGGSIACPNGGSNAAGGTIPAWASYVQVYATAPFKIAVGEATSGSLGVPFAADSHLVAVQPSGGTLNGQCLTPGTIYYAFLKDSTS